MSKQYQVDVELTFKCNGYTQDIQAGQLRAEIYRLAGVWGIGVHRVFLNLPPKKSSVRILMNTFEVEKTGTELSWFITSVSRFLRVPVYGRGGGFRELGDLVPFSFDETRPDQGDLSLTA